MNIAIITARKNSKRIKNKNIKIFLGKPIIAWTIISALKTKIFSNVIVSTDSVKIANISKNYGAEVPFFRPKNISGDKTTTREVILHAIDWLEKNDFEFNNICCLYPTAPLMNYKDIRNAYNILKKNPHKYIFSACKYSYPIQRSFYISKKGTKIVFSKNEKKFSQSFANTYHDAGQFYFAHKNTFRKKITIFSSKAKPIIFPNQKVQDIDNIEDWKICEEKFKILKKIEKKNLI